MHCTITFLSANSLTFFVNLMNNSIIPTSDQLLKFLGRNPVNRINANAWINEQLNNLMRWIYFIHTSKNNIISLFSLSCIPVRFDVDNQKNVKCIEEIHFHVSNTCVH